MDCWLKSGTSNSKESNEYSSNQRTENNEINEGEPYKILKEPIRQKQEKLASTTKIILNLDSHELEMKKSLFSFASFVWKI